MDKLKTTAALVKDILENDKQTRSSDSLLYLRVLEQVAVERDINLHKISVPLFLVAVDKLGLPNFETVRRTRQKVQNKYPDLAAPGETRKIRAEREKAYRAFAKGEYIG